jgi:hypothetical protein
VSGKSRAWILVLAMVAACAAALFAVIGYRAIPLRPVTLLKRLPARDSMMAAIDFAALRRLGVLQVLDGSKMGREAEYEKFVEETQFNYTQDLDYVLASFGPRGKFILARGRFDWKALRGYALNQGGECYNSLCKMEGSTPDRRISFVSVQSNLMALAVSPDEDAALRMEGSEASNEAANIPAPDAAVWLYLPPAVLKSPGELPEGTALFARSLDQAKSVTLGFAPEGDHIAAKLNVLCKSDQDAMVTTAELSKVTEVLRSVIVHAGQRPNARDWSGVLASGKFENKGARVLGYWLIERAFVENVLGAQ